MSRDPNFLILSPEKAQQYFAAEDGDLHARRLLIDLAEQAYSAGHLEACATLLHAEYYLTDREAYKAAPPPKNTIKL